MCHTWRAKEGRGKAKFDDGRQQGRGRVSETRARGVENPSDGTGWAEVSWQAQLQWDGKKGKKERLPRHKLILDWDVGDHDAHAVDDGIMDWIGEGKQLVQFLVGGR